MRDKAYLVAIVVSVPAGKSLAGIIPIIQDGLILLSHLIYLSSVVRN